MKLRIDNSAMDSWRVCPRYFYHYYVDGLRTTDSKQSFAIDKGIKAHKMLEQYYKGESIVKSDDESINQLVDIYTNTYPKDQDFFEVVDTEKTLEVPLAEDITLVMTIDMIAIDKDTREKFIIDHKTTSGLRFLANKIHTTQFETYMYGTNLNTGMINGLSTKVEDLGKPEKLFQRWNVSRSTYQLERWKRHFINDTKKIFSALSDPDQFSQTMNDACMRFNRPCPYFSICNATEKDYADAYTETFIKDTWKNFSITKGE